MKSRRNITAALCGVLLLTAACSTGCSNPAVDWLSDNAGTVLESYDNADLYSAGNAELSESISKIDLNWVSGSITIATHRANTVSLSETSEQELTEESSLHYYVADGTLHVQYVASGFLNKLKNSVLTKDLTLYVPKNTDLDSLQINNVSSDIDLTLKKLNTLTIDNVSGTVNASFQDTVQNLDFNTVSGDLNISAASVTSVKMDTVSGNISLTDAEKASDRLDYSSVSGDFTLLLPKKATFLAKIDSANGTLSSDFPFEKKNKGEYTCGKGTAVSYKLDSVSGDFNIRKVK